MIERMLEAERKGYWQTDAKSLTELAQRYQELAQRFDVRTDNKKFSKYTEDLIKQAVEQGVAGFGLSALPPVQTKVEAAQTAPPVPAAPSKMVTGQQLVKQTAAPSPNKSIYLSIGLIFLAMGAGIWRQQYQSIGRHHGG